MLSSHFPVFVHTITTALSFPTPLIHFIPVLSNLSSLLTSYFTHTYTSLPSTVSLGLGRKVPNSFKLPQVHFFCNLCTTKSCTCPTQPEHCILVGGKPRKTGAGGCVGKRKELWRKTPNGGGARSEPPHSPLTARAECRPESSRAAASPPGSPTSAPAPGRSAAGR